MAYDASRNIWAANSHCEGNAFHWHLREGSSVGCVEATRLGLAAFSIRLKLPSACALIVAEIWPQDRSDL